MYVIFPFALNLAYNIREHAIDGYIFLTTFTESKKKKLKSIKVSKS